MVWTHAIEHRSQAASRKYAVLLLFGCLAAAARASDERDEKSWVSFGTPIADVRLAGVRAGSAAIPEFQAQHLSVILWDERRVPPPPVRDSVTDGRVTAQINTFQRP
jgi:hypothetical protein